MLGFNPAFAGILESPLRKFGPLQVKPRGGGECDVPFSPLAKEPGSTPGLWGI